MPPAPPVTTATLPSNLNISFMSPSLVCVFTCHRLEKLCSDGKYENFSRLTVVDHHIPFFAGSDVDAVTFAQHMFFVGTADSDGAFYHIVEPFLGGGGHFRPAVWLKVGVADGGPLSVGFGKFLQAVDFRMFGRLIGNSLGILYADH